MENLFLKYQRTEIRAKINDEVVLYEPNDEQRKKLRDLISECAVLGDDGSIKGEYPVSAIRYVFSNLVKNGEFVNDLDDDTLMEQYSNVKGSYKKLSREIIDLLNEITEDSIYEQLDYLNMCSKIITLMNADNQIQDMERKFNRFAKRNGYNVKFNDIVTGKVSDKELSKYKKTKK